MSVVTLKPSSVLIESDLAIISLKQGLRYDLTVHLRLNLRYDEPHLTRPNLGTVRFTQV